jgi:hypothetical protein
MEQDQEKIKNLEKNQALFIQELLKEAAEHKNENSVRLITEMAEKENIKLPEKNKPKKKKPIVVEFEDDINDDVYDDELYEDKYTEIDDEDEEDLNTDDFDVPHDLVPLPSKGLIYKGVRAKIPVAYLTASDEDLITSPNLYLDGKIIDLLLRKKILDKTIRPENLCKGDREAIIVWLRATGYGSNFPVSVKDPMTGENFDSTVDLSSLKVKEFILKPDIDGYFDYKLPKTGDLIKFRFLTHKDELAYVKLLERTNPNFKKIAIKTSINSIRDVFQNDSSINSKLKTNLSKAIETFDEYLKIITEENENNNIALKNVTFLLERSIISINGNSDRSYIKKYISFMPAIDSVSLRKYINDNAPGVDFKIKIERPESLGGGSFETFLELDSSIFLNIS